MANLLDSAENSVWHAFDYLALEGDGTAQKPKLKVSLYILKFLDKNCSFCISFNILPHPY